MTFSRWTSTQWTLGAKDPLFLGEFLVVLALLEELKGGKEAKNEYDKVIDKNGTLKTGKKVIEAEQ